jgi:MFS family permease
LSTAAGARRTFLLCLAGVALSSADQSLFTFAIPGIIEEFGIGLGAISLLLTASFALATFVILPIGLLADAIGRRWLFAGLLALSALCVGGQALAPDFTTLAILRIFSFAIAAGLYPLANTLVIEAAEGRSQGLLSGLLQIGYPLGFFIGSMVAVPLIGSHGWRGIFLPGFLIVPLAIAIGLALPETAQDGIRRAIRTGQRSLLAPLARLWHSDNRRTMLLCLSGSYAVSLAIGSFTYFIPTFLADVHGADLGSATRITGLSYAIGSIGYIAAAFIGEYVLGRRNTLVLWAWIGAAALAGGVWLVESPVILIAVLGMTIMFLFGTEAVRMPLIGESFPSEIRATATSLSGSLGVTTGWLTAPLVVAASVPALGWQYTYTLVACLPLLVAGVMFAMLPRDSKAINRSPRP